MSDPTHPYERPLRPGQAPFGRPDRRPRPGRRAGHAQGHRLHRRGPREADRRRRDELDRDDALQLQPSPPRGGGQGGYPGRRRDADGVQHDLGQRRRVDGHRGHEGVARSAARSSPTRSSWSLAATSSTASSASSAATRPGPARRWRSAGSTSPGWPSTRGRSTRVSGSSPTGHRARRDRRQGLRGDRRVPRGQDQPRRAARHRERGLPGPGACGGQFTANTMSMVMEVLGLSPAGLNDDPGRGPGQGRGGPALRRAGDAAGPRRLRPSRFVTRDVDRQRDRRGRGHRRLDERGPPPAGDRPRVRHPPRDRRVRDDRGPHADRRRPPAGRPLHRHPSLRGGRPRRSSSASWSRAGRSTARPRTSTAGRSPRSRPRPRPPRARTSSSRSTGRSRRAAA